MADTYNTTSASDTEISDTDDVPHPNACFSTNDSSAAEDTSSLAYTESSQEIEVVPEARMERDNDEYASLRRILSRACSFPENQPGGPNNTV
jgi:hypothetical protein